MVSRRRILFLPLAAMISAFAGCGGGSTANVQNPPPPPPQNVAIGFQSPPAATILINTSMPLTAVVTHDSSNAGVDWSLTCQTGTNCGSLSSLHTASGTAVTYTSPATLAGNNQSVNIVAYATADHTQNVVAPVAVGAFGSALKGSYVLQAQGVDTSLGPYQFAGVVVLDGNGGITSGEQTVNFLDPVVGSPLTKSDPITSGSYFLGTDGRGTLTITTQDADVGLNGTETFSFVFLSSSQSLIVQQDSGASATGTMDLQTSAAALSGGYAFVVSGTDLATASPTAIGGVVNIDSPGNISGKGSVIDQNLAGTLAAKQALSGTVSTPDSFGAVTLNLNVPTFPTAGSYQFTGYIVDATHIKLIESDNTSGGGSGATGGIAIAQGSATGTFKANTALTGTYVFGISGEDIAVSTPNSLTWAGLYTGDGNGNLTGFMDTYFQGNSAQGTAGAAISAQIGGTYRVDATGTGRVGATINHVTPRPNPSFIPTLLFYLTGNGNPTLVLDASDGSLALSYPSLGVGIAYPQATAPFTFSGDYGFSLTQQNGSVSNNTGQMTATTPANTLSGVVDTNSNSNPTFGNSTSGGFSAPASNGRFAGTLSGPTFEVSPLAVEYYTIDSSRGFVVETDVANPNTPTGVVSFGYYQSRAPVCAGCP